MGQDRGPLSRHEFCFRGGTPPNSRSTPLSVCSLFYLVRISYYPPTLVIPLCNSFLMSLGDPSAKTSKYRPSPFGSDTSAVNPFQDFFHSLPRYVDVLLVVRSVFLVVHASGTLRTHKVLVVPRSHHLTHSLSPAPPSVRVSQLYVRRARLIGLGKSSRIS